MEIQQINSVHNKNLLAFVSLITSALSFLPYLLWVINILLILATNVVVIWFLIYIPISVYSWNGIVFGLIGLITGSIVIGQVKNKQDIRTDHRLAIIGMVVGILGIIANLLFYVVKYLFAFAALD